MSQKGSYDTINAYLSHLSGQFVGRLSPVKWAHLAHTTFHLVPEPHLVSVNISLNSKVSILNPLHPQKLSMYIPSVITQTPVSWRESNRKRTGAMNTPQGRRIGALVGLGMIGVLGAGKLMQSKNQTVVSGNGWELAKVNGEADVLREREAVFG
jgi:hypothetical protein